MENQITSITEKQFFNASSIFIKNLPSIHRKLCGAVDVQKYKILDKISNLDKSIFLTKTIDHESFELNLHEHDVHFIVCDSTTDSTSLGTSENSIQGVVCIKKLLLKSLKVDSLYCLQIINFLQKKITQVCLSNELQEMFSYEIEFKNGKINTIPIFQNDYTENWCTNVLQPKFLKWANSYSEEKPVIISNKLIDSEKFVLLYKSLKQKYGGQLVESWTESTDPKKFVYEDIGIATYLILLWQELGKDFHGFVDLGCGNGLLVYILNSEGYAGYGIDVKRRKIWSTYPPSIKLVEQTIDPSIFQLEDSEHIDWIIGNHSDELSAWIPVISALNSYETKYFLLPCCAYELSGEKFQRRNSKLSVYCDFLQYLEDLSNSCGFTTLLDRLKIPSTKRIAYIGAERTYEKDEYPRKSLQLRQCIVQQLAESKIKLRLKEQSVRNCTQINKTIVDEIVLKIFKILLNQNGNGVLKNRTLGAWNAGECHQIVELVKCLKEGELKVLKSECGGIKTLLKNKHEIFQVDQNTVSIKRPQIKKTFSKETMTYKKRKCFFYYNHPDGCPLDDDDCTFLHEDL